MQDIPDADVVCYGLWVDPVLATHHGVFVSDRNSPDSLDFMLQKPSTTVLEDLSKTHLFLMVVEGKVQSLLQTERLMLNVMQRMSGIATMTRKYAKQIEGTNTRVLDTRKTTPGMRILEKMAVKIGGGVNHRIGLFDMSISSLITNTVDLLSSNLYSGNFVIFCIFAWGV